MQITQAKIGLKFFKDSFLKKFDLQGYCNWEEPTVFFGLYNTNTIYQHKGMGVVVWTGSDAKRLIGKPKLVKYLKKTKHIFHIAISNFIERDLKKVGLPYISLPVLPTEIQSIRPYPLGKCVYMYTSAENPKMYGEHFVHEIKRELPNIKFIICNKNSYSRKQLIQVYKNCFIGLRLLSHDGLSNTVVELGLMGRRVIWNGNTPNAIGWRNIDDVIKKIKYEQQFIGKQNTKIAEQVKDYVDIGKSWLDTEFYGWDGSITKTSLPRDIKAKINPLVKKPSATVIINTVNEKPEYLRQAIESYLKQRFVTMQVIVSTIKGDISTQIAKEYKGVQLVICPEKGIYEQLVHAVKFIKHEWFAYASGNDIAEPTKMYQEIRACQKHKKEVCYSDFYKANENLTVKKTASFHRYSYPLHLEGNYVNDCATVSTRLVMKYGFDLQWGNHAYWDLWLRIYEGEGDVFVYNPSPTWIYRITNDSSHVKRKSNPEQKEKNLILRKKMIEHHGNKSA